MELLTTHLDNTHQPGWVVFLGKTLYSMLSQCRGLGTHAAILHTLLIIPFRFRSNGRAKRYTYDLPTIVPFRFSFRICFRQYNFPYTLLPEEMLFRSRHTCRSLGRKNGRNGSVKSQHLPLEVDFLPYTYVHSDKFSLNTFACSIEEMLFRATPAWTQDYLYSMHTKLV